MSSLVGLYGKLEKESYQLIDMVFLFFLQICLQNAQITVGAKVDKD